jgi:predicted permease
MEGWTMDSITQDLRFAARVMRRSPGFTLVGALTLALGIGANGSIFSLVNGLLFRAPGGITEPERVVQLARSYEEDPRWDNFSWPAMELIADEARALSGVAGFSDTPFVIGRGAQTEQVVGQLVSGRYFEVLGVGPALGRLIQPADDVVPGAHPVVVLSHALWVRRFGSDPGVVGTTLHVGSAPYEIIGVAPEGFMGAESLGTAPLVWIPAMMHQGFRDRLPFDQWGWSWIEVVGRLRDGVTVAEARASMEVVQTRLREADSLNEGILVLVGEGLGLEPAERAEATRTAQVLALIVILVLLLACTNVANLFLSRATSRKSEVGVRMALGAGRGRVARQLITESLGLALVATLLAAPLVVFAGRFLPVVFPYALSVSVGTDARVLLFLVVVGLVTGLVFGAAPAWVSSRRSVTDTLREGASTGGRTKTRLRDVLAVSQLGLSLGLVAGAAMLGRSVINANSADPGFQPDGLVAGFVDLLPTGRYDTETGRDLWARLVSAAADLPGVSAATLASQTPVVGGHSRSTVRPAGRDDIDYEAEYVVVGPDYFETMGIPIVRGRGLGGLDDEPERVVVVNEALAAMFWPGEDPVGRELDRGETWRVVGVARDVQMRSLRAAARPAVYYPLSQVYSSFMALHVRGVGGATLDADRLRGLVESLDPELPVATVVAVREGIAASMGETRAIGFLVGASAALALVLAAVGLFGLVSYGASQRVRELGIRLALGARPGSLARLILARGITLAVMGVIAGLGIAFVLGKALEGLLFGISETDPATLALASGGLLLTAGIAAWLPARRAARVDAGVSLRE